jgi:TonB family protein
MGGIRHLARRERDKVEGEESLSRMHVFVHVLWATTVASAFLVGMPARSGEPVPSCSEGDRAFFSKVAATDLRPIVLVKPRYPNGERDASEIEGWVELLASLLDDGNVRDVCVLKAKRLNWFEQSAADAVRHWRYERADVARLPKSDRRVKIRMEFRLQ